MIDSAIDQYAIENGLKSNDTVPFENWKNYIKKDSVLYNTGADLFGNSYGDQTVDALPRIHQDTFDTLSDVAGTEFFSPYGP